MIERILRALHLIDDCPTPTDLRRKLVDKALAGVKPPVFKKWTKAQPTNVVPIKRKIEGH